MEKTEITLTFDAEKMQALRRRKLRLLGFILRTNPISLCCSSSPHETRCAGLSRGPHLSLREYLDVKAGSVRPKRPVPVRKPPAESGEDS